MLDATKQHGPLTELHAQVWRAISARKDISGKHSATEPAFVPAEDGYTDGKLGAEFPVLRHLDRALDLAREHEFGPIVDAFAAALGEMRWSQNPRYTKENGGASLLNGYAYASLTGPEGPITCLSPRGGFFLMGPDVIYPSHNHAPPEVYLIMSPGVEWRLDEGEWFDVVPGDLVYHVPWQMHAMRTSDRPALAYAAWLEPGNRLDIGFTDTPETA